MWFSNLRFERKVFIIIILVLVFFFAYVYIFLNPLFLDFTIRLTVGFLGILIGFYLDRAIELRKRIKISRQILNNLLVELKRNLELLEKLKPRIKRQATYVTINTFDLFQTTAWNIFSSRFELDNIEVLFKLATIYHQFEVFNEAMKLQSIGDQLSIFLERKPKFFEQVEKDLKEIINLLENL